MQGRGAVKPLRLELPQGGGKLARLAEIFLRRPKMPIDPGEMAGCPVCGARCFEAELLPGGGCSRCQGLPACTRCGHEASRHHGGCLSRVAALGGLAIGRWACPGYSAEPVPAPAAAFEPVELRLRPT